MNRWEYRMEAGGKITTDDLNVMGGSGWELAGTFNSNGTALCIFKRPVVAKTPAMMAMDKLLDEHHPAPPPLEDGCNCPACKLVEVEN